MKPTEQLDDDELVLQLRLAAALADAPPDLVDAAIRCMPSSSAQRVADVLRSGLRVISAALTFDSWAQAPLALGMRSGHSETRHLLFSASGRDIDLRISPAAGSFTLRGQILGPDETGRVELSPQGDDEPTVPARYATALDSLGEFRLDSVRGGSYRLTLRLGAEMIVLPPIEVGTNACKPAPR